MSEWMGTITDMQMNHDVISPESRQHKDRKIKAREVGLKHRGTGAVVRLNDNGTIDAFAGPHLGIRMDPRSNSINLIGDTVNIASDRLNIKTRHYGFSWNGKLFDPNTLRDGDSMMDRDTRSYHSSNLMELVESLDIETYREVE